MSLRDELMKMVEAAGKATPGPWKFSPDTTGSYWIEGADREARKDGAVALAYNSNNDERDARYIAHCSPERIKALCEVAMAAEELGRASLSSNPHIWAEALAANGAALERLGKAAQS